MSITKAFLSLFTAILLLSACSSNSDLFISHSGNMPAEDKIQQLKLGQNEDEVLKLLGSPSSIVSLDRNTWIYMSSDIKQVAFLLPEEVNRDVLTIKFKNSKVYDFKRTSLKDGKEVEIAEEKTETLGHNPGFFAKFFGGTRQYSPFSNSSGGGM